MGRIKAMVPWAPACHGLLASDPDPQEVPEALRRLVFLNWRTLQRAWDCAYPGNKVAPQEDAGE